MHGSVSAHCGSLQHALQDVPQSFGVEAAHRQLPAEQSAPGLQLALHAPQFVFVVSAASHPFGASPSQLPHPLSHTSSEPAQCWCAATTLPHAPQLSGSDVRSTHEVPHNVLLPGHTFVQPEGPHSGFGAEHVLVQSPQVAGLVVDASHPGCPSQFKNPAEHTHADWVHDSFVAHAVVHVPQCSPSEVTSISHPLSV